MAISTRFFSFFPRNMATGCKAVLLAMCIAFLAAQAPAQDAETASKFSSTVVDPYLMAIPANHELTASAVVTAALGGKATAKGIVADGTSAAIAVFKVPTKNSVTFAATNGAKVAAYNADFLSTVSAGAATAAVSPVSVSGSFYALALVMIGTAPDADHGTGITVTATQKNTTKFTETASLLTVPTPVVLVHGLWGGLTSLASTEGYLKTTPAFTSDRSLVTPICYSIYLAFDAAADTLPGHGTGCESTSAQALDAYLSTSLYKQLDTDHYVGGRVDAVVHSMGGLVARHFASTSEYKSVRNRMLGAFRNVVTLDTPETGSALATYLDTVAYNRTFQGSLASTEYLLWANFCGSTSTTIETCFDANGLPLSYPGQPLSTGAVASLIPGGHSIASAPAADVFNTTHGKWYAIASDFKDGDQPASLLRDILNTVIAATYSSQQTAPTVTSILGTPNSDVIVTVASQESTATADQIKEFKDLEHTAAPSEGELLFPDDSNNAVVDSAQVNGQVAYWLGLQTSPAPAVARAEEAGLSGESTSTDRENAGSRREAKPAFAAPERLSAATPEQPVGLGQPLRIPLRIKGPSVVSIAADQIDPGTGMDLRNESGGLPVGGGRAKVVSGEPGAETIEIIPLKIGSIKLRISALFADGGLAQQEYRINVIPSAQGLRQFDLNRGFKALALVLEDREEDRQTFLFPRVQYDGIDYPIYLSDSEQLKLAVDQPEDDPVIRVDSNGLVHALRPGTAVITGDFDGVRDSIRVDVYSQEDAPAGYRRDQNE